MRFDRKQQNSVKQLSFNQKKNKNKKKKKIPGTDQVQKTSWKELMHLPWSLLSRVLQVFKFGQTNLYGIFYL